MQDFAESGAISNSTMFINLASDPTYVTSYHNTVSSFTTAHISPTMKRPN
jgi:vacuolar-type H+-ATPase subunit B/Vma2